MIIIIIMIVLCIGGEYYIVESEQLTFDPFPPSDRKHFCPPLLIDLLG